MGKYFSSRNGEKMLNYIWSGLLLVGFVVAIMNGRVDVVTNAAINAAKSGVNLGIELLGVMCLWTGLMAIAEKGGLVKAFAKILRPLMKVLFPKVPIKHNAIGSMIMNMAANFFGLGNAATPLGLKAMNDLQSLNKNKESATDAMCMFLVINTATIQLVPATVIAIRSAAGSLSPTEIMLPIWIASITAFIVGVITSKIFAKVWRW